MKQRVWHSSPKRLRFVRWSRNAAAAFHSVKLEVNIGRLKASVQERIAPKANMIITLHSIIQSELNAVDRDEAEHLHSEGLCEAYLLCALTLGDASSVAMSDASN